MRALASVLAVATLAALASAGAPPAAVPDPLTGVFEGRGVYGLVEGSPDLLADACDRPEAYEEGFPGTIRVLLAGAVLGHTFHSDDGDCQVARVCAGTFEHIFHNLCPSVGLSLGGAYLAPRGDGTYAFYAYVSTITLSTENIVGIVEPVG